VCKTEWATAWDKNDAVLCPQRLRGRHPGLARQSQDGHQDEGATYPHANTGRGQMKAGLGEKLLRPCPLTTGIVGVDVVGPRYLHTRTGPAREPSANPIDVE